MLGEISDHPHTIDNGAGERLTFLGIRSDEQGEYLEVTNTVSPGSGPPMHVHHLQEEGLTVDRGTMGWQRLGEEEHRLATAPSSGWRTFPVPCSAWCSRSWWLLVGFLGGGGGLLGRRSR